MISHASRILLICIYAVICDPIIIKIDNPSLTTVTTRNVTAGEIGYKLLDKPHHLFIGRCKSKDIILHEENIILTNDGKSHVTAKVRMNIEGPFLITCVNVYDQAPNGEGGYPTSPRAGVGRKWVEFNVLTTYGKGFQFYVQIYGEPTNEENRNITSTE